MLAKYPSYLISNLIHNIKKPEVSYNLNRLLKSYLLQLYEMLLELMKYFERMP